MKYLKKTLSFVLAFAMAFTMVIVPRGSSGSVADAATLTEDVTYFSANMYRYDTNSFNALSQQKAKDEGKDSKVAIQFNDGGTYNDGNPDYNKWTGHLDTDNDGSENNENKDCPYTGIVENKLVNGNIKFKYPEAGIFENNNSENSSGKSTKEFYTNVGIPFKKDSEGYYCFDSTKYDVYFPTKTNSNNNNNELAPENGVNLEYTTNGNVTNFFTSNQYASHITTGFFPFNGLTTLNGSKYTRNKTPVYHFGMSMSIPFYMTNGGWTKDSKGTDVPIEFDFSGDDDVWVFVDGELVLDLGGIHDPISGKIDFSTGKVTVYEGLTSTENKAASTVNTYIKDEMEKNGGQLHNLQIFYLERGKGGSNCSIRCNLPQSDKLEVSKLLGNKKATDEDLGALKKQDFEFTLSSSDTESGTYSPVKGASYTLLEDNTIIEPNIPHKTSATGKFTLKFNQKAIFDSLTVNKYYKVSETASSGSSASWKTAKNGKALSQGNNLETDPFLIKTERSTKNTYTCNFTNSFDATIVDDVVVLDYGKKAIIDVLANDVSLGDTKTISGISKIDGKNKTTSPLRLTNGEVTMDSKKLTYRPFKYMDSVDKLTYYATIKNKEYPGNVSIIPATTVYYEDNFGGNGTKEEGGLAIKYTGDWSTVKDDGKKTALNKEGPGNTNTDIQDDGTVGKPDKDGVQNQYGYDSSYDDDTKFSDGSAAVVEGEYKDGKFTAGASFDFKGTGFDIISRTDKSCGMIKVTVTNKETNKVTKIPVVNKSTNTLYQIPVISCTGLPYGEYTVNITVYGKDENLGWGSTFYLDAIRIYNPMYSNAVNDGNNKDVTNGGNEVDDIEALDEVEAAYDKDKELNILTQFIGDILVANPQTDTTINGAVYIDTVGDGSHDTNSMDKYNKIGPNQEVYLSKGGAITFTANAKGQKPIKVYLGAKSPNGKPSTLDVKSTGGSKELVKTIKSATEMYYDITKYVEFKEDTKTGEYKATIVIGNDASVKDILSLTNLKFIYEDSTEKTSLTYSMDSDTYKEAKKMAISLLNKKDDDKQEEVKKANLEITSAKFNSSKVSVFKTATLTVKTSADVKYLGILDSKGNVIDPKSVESKVDKSLVGTDNDSIAKTWTVKIDFNELGNQKVVVYGIAENGDVSKTQKEASIKVNLLGSFKNWFTEW